MKILVIGEIASGKSTFAHKLGERLSLPVIHLDEMMDSVGRRDKDGVRKMIEQEIQNEDWILDGNAFTKDKDKRIRAADVIFVFSLNPFVSLYRHFCRYLKTKFTDEKRVGGKFSRLNIAYFVPYIFFKFPKRKQAAILLARSQDKKIFEINSFSEADDFISNKIDMVR